MVARDGRTVWVHDETVLIRDEQGTPLFWQGVLYDVTQQKRAEQELAQALDMERLAVERLREADDMKNTFLTAVSHDLRTPLSAILGSSITLESADELGITDDDRRQLIRSLARKARRLTAMVNDLLDIDRLTRGWCSRSRNRSISELSSEGRSPNPTSWTSARCTCGPSRSRRGSTSRWWCGSSRTSS